MKVTNDDLANVAKLSRLSIADSEQDEYMKDLNDFLTYVENLEAVSTDDIEPTTYALPMQNVFRADEVRESLNHEDALLNAPESEDGYFKVPRILN